jgi:hypothetical protein
MRLIGTLTELLRVRIQNSTKGLKVGPRANGATSLKDFELNLPGSYQHE